MASERGLRRDARGLRVTDFADHDDIGVVPEHGTQRAGEIEADLGLDLYLIQAFDLELHRIFDRDDLALGVVEPVEGCIERRRLAGPRRPRDQDQAVRPLEKFRKPRMNEIAKPKLAEIQPYCPLIENSDRHRFPENDRSRRHAQVDLTAADVHLYGTV